MLSNSICILVYLGPYHRCRELMLKTNTRTRSLWQSNEAAFYNMFKIHDLKLSISSFNSDEHPVQNIAGCTRKTMNIYNFLMEKQRYMSYKISVKLSKNECVKEFDRFLSD